MQKNVKKTDFEMLATSQNLTFYMGLFAMGFYLLQFGQLYKSIYVSHFVFILIFLWNISAIIQHVFRGAYGDFCIIVSIAMIPGALRALFTDDPSGAITILLQFIFLFFVVTPSFIFIVSKNICAATRIICIFAMVASIIVLSIFLFEIAGYNLSGTSFFTIPLGKEGVEGFAGRYGIGNPNSHAILMAMAIVFVFSCAQKFSLKMKLATLLVIISILLTFSRGAYIMLAFSIGLGWLATSVSRKKLSLKFFARNAIILAMIFVTLIFIFEYYEDTISNYLSLARIVDASETFEDEKSPGGRVSLLASGIEGISENMFFGIGLGQALSYIGEEIPHVFIVLWALENGLLSTILLLLASAFYLQASFYSSFAQKNFYILFGSIGFLLWTFTSTYPYYPGFALMFGIPYILIKPNGFIYKPAQGLKAV